MGNANDLVRIYAGAEACRLRALNLADKVRASRESEIAFIKANIMPVEKTVALLEETHTKYRPCLFRCRDAVATAERQKKECAKLFYNELCVAVYGNANTRAGGIMSSALIAQHMHIEPYEADVLMKEAVLAGYTEKQGGMWVV